MKRVFELFTDPHDIVLDFFLGSGTTAAVAQKWGGAISASRWASMLSPLRLGLEESSKASREEFRKA